MERNIGQTGGRQTTLPSEPAGSIRTEYTRTRGNQLAFHPTNQSRTCLPNRKAHPSAVTDVTSGPRGRGGHVLDWEQDTHIPVPGHGHGHGHGHAALLSSISKSAPPGLCRR